MLGGGLSLLGLEACERRALRSERRRLVVGEDRLVRRSFDRRSRATEFRARLLARGGLGRRGRRRGSRPPVAAEWLVRGCGLGGWGLCESGRRGWRLRGCRRLGG